MHRQFVSVFMFTKSQEKALFRVKPFGRKRTNGQFCYGNRSGLIHQILKDSWVR